VVALDTGYIDSLDLDIEIDVPDDDSGLYAIDLLDPWIQTQVVPQEVDQMPKPQHYMKTRVEDYKHMATLYTVFACDSSLT